MQLPLGPGVPARDDGWQEISTAPFGRDLELAVIDRTGVHSLVFACRRILGGWMKAANQERLSSQLQPTHWRDWLTR